MRHLIPHIVLLSAALSALAAFACSGDSKDETETHFLACKTDDDCRKHGEAFSCVQRQCRENAGTGGAGSGGSSSGGNTATGGTTFATGGLAQSGGAGGATSGTGGTGTGGAGACGDPGQPCCDPFPGDGPNYCHGAYRCDGTSCIDCNCPLGAYVPVCGTDGQTYDIACGRACAPVPVACNGECPCIAPCPAQPPQQGTSCGSATTCFYERCSTYGRVRAQCAANQWTVETGTCAEGECGPTQCTAGQACVVRQGGALLSDCMPNTCNGLVTCDCVQGCFQGCRMEGTVGAGMTVTCNTCPEGNCP